MAGTQSQVKGQLPQPDERLLGVVNTSVSLMKELTRHAYPDVDPVIVEEIEKHRGKRFSEVWAIAWPSSVAKRFAF